MNPALAPFSPSAPTEAAAVLLDGVAPLTHLGVIRVAGEDAAKFLHGQLTQDFALLGNAEARLAAFCSAKGRMQASFIGFRRAAEVPEVLLVMDLALLAPTLKRLSMFVLRAKAKLTDATAEFALYGLAGEAARAVLPADAPAWQKTEFDTGAGVASVVALYPAEGQQRALWVAPTGAVPPAGAPLAEEVWQWGEVRSGIATLNPAVFEAFVPQMLNFESVGGVNFKKGCYPGQEVVARSQFRGTLKRRAFIAHADAGVQAGQEIFASQDETQPVGTVVQVAVAPGGGFDTIVSMQLSAVESAVAGGLHAGSAAGPSLTLLPLPYVLLEDI